MSGLELKTYGVMAFSLAVALLLNIYPLPMEWRWWRPDFVLIVVIYWMYLLPLSLSLVAVCCFGILLDALEGMPFGQHGLALVILAYICLLTYQRVRNYSIWQYSLWVFFLVTIAQLTDTWVQAMSGRPVPGLEFLLPAFASACFWPLCYLGLERIRRRYRIVS
jgi:rod shape-determining protein MreD